MTHTIVSVTHSIIVFHIIRPRVRILIILNDFIFVRRATTYRQSPNENTCLGFSLFVLLATHIIEDMGKMILCLLLLSFTLLNIANSKRSEDCELPAAAGPCRGLFPSFYFNPSANRCEHFIYGGCQGRRIIGSL